MIGQGTPRQMVGLAASVVLLAVAAVVEMPVGAELGAARPGGEVTGDSLPRSYSVKVHVVGGDLIGDPLVAQNCNKPVEQCRRVPVTNGCGHAFRFQRCLGIINESGGPSELADSGDQPGCMANPFIVLGRTGTVV